MKILCQRAQLAAGLQSVGGVVPTRTPKEILKNVKLSVADGKATLVVGTHTHVQSADERILPNGTAYLTDAGMTGPHDGIIGMEREPSMSRFLTGMSSKLEPASANPRLNGVLVSADDKTGRATSVTRLSYSEQDLSALASRGAATASSRSIRRRASRR